MTTNYYWLWEKTLAEILRDYFVTPNSPTSIRPETAPFKSDRRPTEGGLHYQLALPPELRAVQPAIPGSGDHRSGILILDGDLVVGSFLLKPRTLLQVLPSHRGRGISQLLFSHYYKEVRLLPGGMGVVNTLALKSFVPAYASIVRWAVQSGKNVPKNVVDAIESGQEAALLLRRVGLAA